MLIFLLKLVVAAAQLGPVIAAYVVAPAEAQHAWPALIVVSCPAVGTLIAGVVFHAWRARLEEPLPTAADEWLRAEIARQGKVCIRVATMAPSERNRDSFYHPASRTIVLSDSVVGQHTAHAHATAGHELGHAMLHLDRPALSHVLWFARAQADTALATGAGLLAGAILVGGDGLRAAAVALIAAASVLHALIVVEEVMASAIARSLLRDHLTAPDHGRTAHAHLRRALATYLLRFAGVGAGLVIAALAALRGGDGVLVPAPPLSGRADTVADVAAVVAVAAAAATLLRTRWPANHGPLQAPAALLQAQALAWCPLLAVLLCAQPAPPWTIAFAAVTAWPILSAPVLVAVGLLASFLVRGLSDLELAFPIAPGVRPRSVSSRHLVDHEEPPGLLARLAAAANVLWPVPLALWWLT